MSQDAISATRIKALALKEFRHIRRDPFTLAMAFVLPFIIVFIFGFAIEFNLSSIPTAFVDFDKKPASRDLIESFSSSNYFKPLYASTPDEGLKMLESERAKAVVIIPTNFEKDLKSGKPSSVQILMDAADNSSVSSISGYLLEIQKRSSAKILERQAPQMLNIKSRFLFNPELRSSWFVVPGLAVVVTAILSILLTSLTIAREWESGSMELLLSTPVKPVEIILGKLIPYGLLGLGAVTMVYFLARIVFGLPFQGSHLAFAVGCILFLVTALVQGMIISIITRRQVLAMQLGMMAGLLPSVLLSGFIFPIESMHPFFRNLTALLPARWFMNIARNSFLQTLGSSGLMTSFVALAILATVLILVGSKKLRKDLEP